MCELAQYIPSDYYRRMSTIHDQTLTPVAAEVLELGQALFDAVIEAAAAPPPVEGETRGPFPTDDVRAAAEEFFTALRAPLGETDRS